jgi:hypothetical protein
MVYDRVQACRLDCPAAAATYGLTPWLDRPLLKKRSEPACLAEAGGKGKPRCVLFPTRVRHPTSWSGADEPARCTAAPASGVPLVARGTRGHARAQLPYESPLRRARLCCDCRRGALRVPRGGALPDQLNGVAVPQQADEVLEEPTGTPRVSYMCGLVAPSSARPGAALGEACVSESPRAERGGRFVAEAVGSQRMGVRKRGSVCRGCQQPPAPARAHDPASASPFKSAGQILPQQRPHADAPCGWSGQ